MSRKLTLLLILFSFATLAAFVFVRPAFAGCDPNKFSQNDSYNPPSGICGDSGGVADCCNTDPSTTARNPCPGSGARCWPAYTEISEVGCPPGDTVPVQCRIAFGGPVDPDYCCPSANALNTVCGLAVGSPVTANNCDEVKAAIGARGARRNYCEPPASRITINSKLQCAKVTQSGWSNKVTDCRAQGPGVPATAGIQTAIGCIPTSDLVDTAGFVMRWVFGFAGGVILLMLIVTGYSLITSTGNPEKLQAVRENLVAIFSGIILIAFSLVLLKAIGANVLGLPGF